VLAKHFAQVFYVLDTTNKRLKVVIPGKRRIVGVENAVDEEEFDQFDEIPPFVTSMTKQEYHRPTKLLTCTTATMKKSRI
jgi:hypothetical protein